MVTVQEALQQTQVAETSALERGEEIRRAERAARAIRVRGGIEEQIRLGSGFAQARRAATRERTQALADIAQQRQELGEFRGEIAQRRQDIQTFQTQREAQQAVTRSLKRDLAAARKFAARGSIPATESARVKKLFASQRARDRAAEQTRILEVEQLAPIVLAGQIRGFRSERTGQSFELAQLPEIQPSALVPLERAGLIQTEAITREPIFTPLTQTIPPSLTIPIDTVSPTFRPSGLAGLSSDIERRVGEIKTKGLRGQEVTLRERALAFGLVAAKPLVQLPGALTGLGRGLATEPVETIRGIPGGIATSFSEIGSSLESRFPEQAIAGVLGEVALGKGLGKAVSVGGKITRLGTARLSPGFKPIKTREIPGLGIEERVISGIPEIGDIALIRPRLEKQATTLRPSVRGGFGFTKSEQAKFIGQTDGTIVSAQAGFGAFGVPLEREFFATPPIQGTGFVRLSRLGDEAPAASALDILRGEFTFRRPKPEIIAFPGEVVGRPGGFQPFGLPSTELETTLPAGSIIRRRGQAAVTIFEGRPIPIISAEISQATPEISQLFKRATSGDTLSPRQLRRLSSETGFDFSRRVSTRPVLSFPRTGVSGGLPALSRQFSGFGTTRGIGIRATRDSFGFPSLGLRGLPRAGFGIPSPPPATPSRGLESPGLLGLGGISPGITFPGFDVDPLRPVKRKDPSRKKKKKLKVKKRKKITTPLRPSFSALALGIEGVFPKELAKGLGLLPGQLRVIPRRTRRRK